MAESGTAGAEPKGLNMSLDAIIKEKKPEKRGDNTRKGGGGLHTGVQRGKGKRQYADQGGRGRGRFHGQGWQVCSSPKHIIIESLAISHGSKILRFSGSPRHACEGEKSVESRSLYGVQGPQSAALPFPPNAQRMVRVDTGAERGKPGSGPVLLLPPEFLVRLLGACFASVAARHTLSKIYQCLWT